MAKIYFSKRNSRNALKFPVTILVSDIYSDIKHLLIQIIEKYNFFMDKLSD